MSKLFSHPAMKRLGGSFLERWLASGVAWLQMRMLRVHKDRKVLDVIRSIWRDRRGWPLPNEAFLLHSLATSQKRLPGDFAEVGVFLGSSARMICEGKGNKRLYLLDTFEGLPNRFALADKGYTKGQYVSNAQSVAGYLKAFPDVHVIAGVFPESVSNRPEIQNAQFSLVHIDVDLEQVTRDCLEFFYPRMVPGGIIVSHDYSFLTGVRNAFDEFLADKPERVVELPSFQCLLVKLPSASKEGALASAASSREPVCLPQ